MLDRRGIAAKGRAHIDIDTEPLEDLGRSTVRFRPVNQPAKAARFIAHYNVFSDAAQWHQVELLVDRGNACVLCLARACYVELLAGKVDRARVTAIDPRQDLHQRRLASTILANHGMHLSGRNFELRRLQRCHASEGL